MSASKKKPDWSLEGWVHWGGNFPEDFPKPHIWYFPHPEGKKRKVKWLTSSFLDYSYAIGAKHYYGTLTEEENYIWSFKEGAWCRPWHNPGGKSFTKRFLKEHRVKEWLKKTFKKEFDPEKYELVNEYEDLYDDVETENFWPKEKKR